MKDQKNVAIDCGILPLVTALRGINGVTTLASCEGHILKRWNRFLLDRPYVFFISSPHIGAKIGRLIRDFSGKYKLKRHWEVLPVFNYQFELCFSLECITYQRNKFYMLIDMLNKQIDVNSDILKLTKIINEHVSGMLVDIEPCADLNDMLNHQTRTNL